MCSEKELFGFHEKNVRVKTTDGETIEGICWAYSEAEDAEEDGHGEAYLSFCGPCVYASEIEKIELI